MKRNQRVLMAEPNLNGRLSRDGGARQTLARQFQFPFEYDVELEDDRLIWLDSDRIADSAKYEEVVRKHTGGGSGRLGLWWFFGAMLKRPSDEKVLEFLKEILQKADPSVDPKTEWTGYRVTGTDNRRGYNTWTFWLFAKHPDSDTEVFSNENAPNVLPRLRRDDESLLDTQTE